MSWSKEYKETEIVKDYTKVLGKIWDSLMPSSYPLVLDFKTKRAVEVKKRNLVGPYHFDEVFIDYNCHAFIDNKPLLDLGWDGTNMTEEDVVKIYTNEYFSGMREHMRQLSKYAGLKFSNFDMGGKISITITDK